MALIHCPECGREVSDRASSCPGCGFPLTPADTISDTQARLEEAQKRDKKAAAKIGLLLLAGIAAILAFAFFSGRAV